ncbi:hypothetical protein P4O66_001861 [Electrophorus voltai]|uniref:Uncharacterized protein n=1 Tax=Electrophorus voltai TaxID=2609070 RepID=A0AAD8Z405_9TELE|nr:hypothetical protein P4O66_001861 [Electrophorus voltai]
METALMLAMKSLAQDMEVGLLALVAFGISWGALGGAASRFGEFFYDDEDKKMEAVEFLLKLTVAAAEFDAATGESFTKLLTSVCSYTTFPFRDDDDDDDDCIEQKCFTDFLLDLYSHVKDSETQTGRSVLPALQPVYQSAPAVWKIDLLERKTSLFLEVLKLQTGKKPVELRGWSDEESEVRSFLQCLPYISQLRFEHPFYYNLHKRRSGLEFLLKLTVAAAECDAATGESFTKLLTSVCSYTTFPLDGHDENDSSKKQCDFLLDLFSQVKDYETQTGRSVLPALQPVYQSAPAVWYIDLSERKTSLFLEVLKLQTGKKPVELRGWSDEESEVRSFLQCLPYISQLSTQQTEGALSRVLSSLASLLRLWHVQCLNLTEYKMEAQSLTVLLCHQGPLTIRLRKETLQHLVVVVYEAQEEELTRCFLKKVGGDLTSCTLNWEVIHYFLQYQTVTVDFRKSSIKQQNPRDLLPVLARLQIRSVDRLLLLRLLHCCSVSDLQQGAAAADLLSALQHRLDFSCSSALDLTADTQTHTLTLSTEDCTVVSMVIQRAHTHTQLTLHDCEIEEPGVEQLFPILHTVTLHCSKATLLQFLSLVHVGTELECVRRAMALSRALGEMVDLSQTRLDQQTCRSLALFLEHSEGLSELDLSHCQLTDHCLQMLFPHLHKAHVLDAT